MTEEILEECAEQSRSRVKPGGVKMSKDKVLRGGLLSRRWHQCRPSVAQHLK